MKLTPCRSCHHFVGWVVLPSGKRMPLDPEPVERGNVLLTGDGFGRVLTADEAARAEPGTLYRSHFASCPDAPMHRRKPEPVPGKASSSEDRNE